MYEYLYFVVVVALVQLICRFWHIRLVAGCVYVPMKHMFDSHTHSIILNIIHVSRLYAYKIIRSIGLLTLHLICDLR